MNKRLWSKKNNANFYLPGEEISLQQDEVFAGWTDKNSSGYAGKGRILRIHGHRSGFPGVTGKEY